MTMVIAKGANDRESNPGFRCDPQTKPVISVIPKVIF